MRVSPITLDPLWYRDAILYELRVRSFMDGNGDGIGDFLGLTQRLDYLQDLGVTALWLLPFYPSPGLDDGYDIASYTDVHPELGSLDDFRRFLDEAHARGLRVITELVVNHTSDQHPWFQRARRAPPGSPERDFYVWSDTPEKYAGTRVIFKDFEPSNWSWDPVARAWFWHRFYAHQPDLNYDHPAVHEAVTEAMDFWLGLGVDGLRLDAVPYLYEREGTSCENLPETHAFLKKLRAHVDARFANRMLLAEANQWPEDAVAYFGQGDECHMSFHFPIMPRLFMSIHMEDRFPLIDILDQTPELGETCQWALFLRNHDELTLEMVTEEERDYMWRAFAHESAMRLNLGIRRRLAPLVGNDRRNIELMNGLLFSMPGTPVIYYGDELGMGDNVYLGDRNGVRTPMQWSSDRNAGFSRANPQKLVLPVIVDPEYHYESVNVEAQQSNTNSLLWWTKRMIALRKRFRAFGRGSIRFLHPENPRVLAFVRQHEDELVLVVANLSRHVQYVELDLSAHQGMTPIELFGRTRFPRIGELPYLLTLGGHAFYWFSLEPSERAEEHARVEGYEPPTVAVDGPPTAILSEAERPTLQGVLPAWITSRPWFGPRPQDLPLATVVDAVELAPVSSGGVQLAVTRLDGPGIETSLWIVPLAVESDPEAGQALRLRLSHTVLAQVRGGDDGIGVLHEAAGEAEASTALLSFLATGTRAKGRVGDAIATRTHLFAPELVAGERRALHRTFRHASIVVGERSVLKLYRRFGEGLAPDVEIGRFLAAATAEDDPRRLAPTPALLASLEIVPGWRMDPVTVASLHAYVPHELDARAQVERELGRFLDRAIAIEPEGSFATPTDHLVELARAPTPEPIAERIGAVLDMARLLGIRTAELHRALVSETEPAFSPEPFDTFYQRSMYQTLRNLAGRVSRELARRVPRLEPGERALAERLLAERGRLYARFAPLVGTRMRCARTRHHGDLRLQKWLYTGRDYLVVDFSGDRDRPLTEHRRKHSPVRDVASMLISLQSAAHAVLLDPATLRETDRPRLEAAAAEWWAFTGAAYLRAWLGAAEGQAFVPSEAELRVLLDASMIERRLLELGSCLAEGHGLEPTLRGLSSLLG